jgi:hypothetical protein
MYAIFKNYKMLFSLEVSNVNPVCNTIKFPVSLSCPLEGRERIAGKYFLKERVTVARGLQFLVDGCLLVAGLLTDGRIYFLGVSKNNHALRSPPSELE